jgi:poly-gamma-glutamate capsule biosynthesis protein CapA/YwtB (metallophosphatase superfamily)
LPAAGAALTVEQRSEGQVAHRQNPRRGIRLGPTPAGLFVISGLTLAIVVAFGLPWQTTRVGSPGPSAGSGATIGHEPSSGPPLSLLPSAIASPSSAPTTAPALVAVPIVAVADYRSTTTSIGSSGVAAVVNGTSPTWASLELVADQADAILMALGQTRNAARTRLLTARNAATLMADLAAHRDRLGFLRADQVGPGVRALGWNGQALFGVHRLKSMGDWQLSAMLPVSSAPYDPSTTWTLFAGGDLGLDRTYAYVVKNLHKGPDYPFNGGTARVAGLTCCSTFGWKVPTIVSTGHAGAMRDLISSADLALANMEESAPDHFTYHPTGTSFTGDPALIAGIARAGIDVASCASTHIGDGGPAGILQTVRSLKKYGIVPFGAGPNLAAARRPAIFTEGGVKVAIIGYDGISGKYYGATASTIGDTPLNPAFFKADVAAARAAGAAVVIAFPHWGIEYTGGPSPLQQRLGHQMVDAGFDIVIGNHPHWAQAMEVYKGKPIWYSLGNFTFDQGWSEPTLEGITLELTFRGGTLVQAWMNPHILIDSIQPNLLDLAGDGQRVLQPIYRASAKLLPW